MNGINAYVFKSIPESFIYSIGVFCFPSRFVRDIFSIKGHYKMFHLLNIN